VIPIGNYAARVVSFQWGKTAKDAPFVRLLLRIEGGDQEGGEITSDVFVLRKTGEPNEIAREQLIACGWDGADLATLNGITDNAIDISVSPDSYTDNSGTLKTVHRARLNVGGPRKVKIEVDKKGLDDLNLKFRAAPGARPAPKAADEDDFPV
jgi:hypothetical protein